MAPREHPSHIDRYEVQRVLGEGGMGTVYLCRDPKLDRAVAVKRLHPNRQQPGGAQRARFLREAYATAQLQHPGIPPVYDVCAPETGPAFYVMKPIEGKSLQEILDALRDDLPEYVERYELFDLVEILREVCQTVHYAHTKGYLHRDLKPSNIFVGDHGEVYVIDWGLTKALAGTDAEKVRPRESDPVPAPSAVPTDDTVTLAGDLAVSADTSLEADESGELTLAGDILGTVAYMAPEQAAGRTEDVGKETDIYALGVILYEILTLELPIQGDSFAEVVDRKHRGEFIPPEEIAPHRTVPPELAAAVAQAMAPLPKDRFRQARGLFRALETWLEGKTDFRTVIKGAFARDGFEALPWSRRGGWRIGKETLTTRPTPDGKPSWLLFKRECAGDVRVTLHALAQPLAEGDDAIAPFGVVIHGSYPQPFQDFVDGYTVHFAASGNTRAYLTKNDVEVASNEYVVLEPNQRYRITVEQRGSDLRVLLNGQVVLYHRDRGTVTGLRVGFLHGGPGLVLSGVRVQTRGLPTRTSTLDIPEALMAEGCHEAALRHFLAYAHGHRHRREGAFARYRASLAAFRHDGDKKLALRVLRPLKNGPFAVFEYLGRARIAIEEGDPLGAARILQHMLDREENPQHLDPVADVAFRSVQLAMRGRVKGERGWKLVDAWTRICLVLGQRVESHRSMTPSVLWRWILLALTRYPKHLEECLRFLRRTFGKDQGAFAEILTAIDPLVSILRRSAEMPDHHFLVDRIMRLILHHDDNLGSLETLARFYLHAGNDLAAWQLSQHIYTLCTKHEYRIPPMPMTLMALMEWLEGNPETARHRLADMVEKSREWAIPDGMLLLGLEAYRLGRDEEARDWWERAGNHPEAENFNRHLVARGLLGELPPSPEAAEIPNRADHRLLYCLFLGYRHWFAWLRHREDEDRALAVDLLQTACGLQRPSYDIYSTTDAFLRRPLEELGAPLPPRDVFAKLPAEEQAWLDRLTHAASQEAPDETRHTSSTSRSGGSRKRRPKTPKGLSRPMRLSGESGRAPRDRRPPVDPD